MDAEQFRAALTDLLGAQPPLNPLIRDSSASVMPLAEIPQGCSSNFPTLVAVSA